MKNEHAFNNYLGKELRRMIPDLHVYKAADKYSVVPDFLLWCVGTSSSVEVKFVKDIPDSGKAKVLTHPFSGGQIAFMRHMEKTKNFSYGLVAKHSSKIMYVIRCNDIPDKGNFSVDEFNALPKKLFEYGDIEALVGYFFFDHSEGNYDERG